MITYGERQLALLPDNIKPVVENPDNRSRREWGTFKDSLKAPIHRWFTYPAGFSYKAVEYSLKTYGVTKGQTVYDPFMGSGTTNVVAKTIGINSYGVEAHPFIFEVAQAKLDWSINPVDIRDALNNIEDEVRVRKPVMSNSAHDILKKEFPELILKCYSETVLLELLIIRDVLLSLPLSRNSYRFLFVGLASLLRQVSSAATGWPYIAPKKSKITSNGKIPIVEFKRCIYEMLDDIRVTIAKAEPSYDDAEHHYFNEDSRNTIGLIPNNSIDHIFTSPPYLNNFDYADRTRLELYFFGRAKTWRDISDTIRSRLITSATTQISRNDPRYIISSELRTCCPDVFMSLQTATKELSKLRLQKGGKKSYDLLVSGYFNDMYLSLKDAFRVLKNNCVAVYVLGDSAPYGVHIPTDEFIGKIALNLGFSEFKILTLRERGGKWPNNPQRHKVKLKESVVILKKS
ncbi:MAG: DNA methyltransferase [Dehalococcoidales bacterium]|nr:DNA methyltransferase [Dehalococcoidales bacterium]